MSDSSLASSPTSTPLSLMPFAPLSPPSGVSLTGADEKLLSEAELEPWPERASNNNKQQRRVRNKKATVEKSIAHVSEVMSDVIHQLRFRYLPMTRSLKRNLILDNSNTFINAPIIVTIGLSVMECMLVY